MATALAAATADRHVHAVTVEGSEFGPYVGERTSAILTGFEKLLFNRGTAEQIVADLAKDSSALLGAFQGDTLHFTWTADHDGEGGHEVVHPDETGLYAVGGLWPWSHWRPSDTTGSSPTRTLAAAVRQPAQVLVPVHLAGSGDAAALIRAFVDQHDTWSLWTPTSTNAYVAIRECMTVAVKADFDAVPDLDLSAAWTVYGYDSPAETPTWRAKFDSTTPCEVVLAFLNALELELEYGDAERGRLTDLWPAIGWNPDGWGYTAPDGALGGKPYAESVVLWGGVLQHRWTAWFSEMVPEAAIRDTIEAVAERPEVLRDAAAVPVGHTDVLWPRNQRRAAANTTSTVLPDAPVPAGPGRRQPSLAPTRRVPTADAVGAPVFGTRHRP
ncbi:DUF317 domain-containing protein [Streptacidiphilus sp. MAP5-52]|uniref:DUF317 domain-containing protein n=1 Tax=Streptacidiphilus sp. MAP5-52 TaxID=3156267 RepID=UPI00351291B1